MISFILGSGPSSVAGYLTASLSNPREPRLKRYLISDNQLQAQQRCQDTQQLNSQVVESELLPRFCCLNKPFDKPIFLLRPQLGIRFFNLALAYSLPLVRVLYSTTALMSTAAASAPLEKKPIKLSNLLRTCEAYHKQIARLLADSGLRSQHVRSLDTGSAARSHQDHHGCQQGRRHGWSCGTRVEQGWCLRMYVPSFGSHH